MTSTNFPAALVENQPSGKNYKNLFIGISTAVALILGGTLIYENNKSSQTIQQDETKIATISNEKSEVQKNFDASLARLDSMTSVNSGMQKQLEEKNSEIAKVKTEIRGILNKEHATVAELSKAKALISLLNGKINTLEQEVARLTKENESLTNDKIALTSDKEKLNKDLASTTADKQELEKKVDTASTLNASNIVIKPINVKHNGKEKITSTAKRIDKMVISFDVDNRIAKPGLTDVYVLVIDPEGNPITTGSETFTLRDGGDKAYTAKLPISLDETRRKNVEFSFVPGTGNSFKIGNYTVRIYQNGFKIGEGKCELKKGGLFKGGLFANL